MKRLIAKTKGLIKGAPVAVLFSIAFHAILITVAAGYVITAAIKKAPPEFTPPPPVNTKTIPLKKPTVKTTKSKPSEGSTKIVSKSKLANMNFQLPEISGTGKTGFGEGLGGGPGGYNLLPDVSGTLFGGEKSAAVGNDFVGTFYVLNRTRDGKDLGYDRPLCETKVTKFIENDWSVNVFAPYYRSPKKLYATQFVVPLTPAMYGPEAFGVDFKSGTSYPEWVAHYKGKISSKKGGQYRFWGDADEILFVRINGKLVLNGSWHDWQKNLFDWQPDAKEHLKYALMAHLGYASVGHWFTLEPGEVVEMEVLFGDLQSPHFGVYLMIEDQAEAPYYSRRKMDGMPILPAFRTAEMSEAIKDQIKYEMFPEEMDLDGGEIFNVY
jgi:hypothetical protein